MLKITDQTNRIIELKTYPKKIISTVPSISELLAYYKLGNNVCGITKFCIYPENWFKDKERIGGTKSLNIKKIEKIRPDLIIANKEENDKEQIEYLASKFPTYISDIVSFEDALQMISHLGLLSNKDSIAENLVAELESKREEFGNAKKVKRKAAYLIWNEPKMVAGCQTYIHTMLKIAGFENVFKNMNRYPAIDEKTIQAANPEVVLLSSEPFPFKEKHINYFQNLLPNAKVLLVDGTYFSWYGNRMLDAFAYFNELRVKS